MSESFEQFKQAVSQPEAFSSDDVLDAASLEKLGGPVLTKDDLQHDGRMVKAEEKQNARDPYTERPLRGLTNTSEFSVEQLRLMQEQVFASKPAFFYEKNRIKSIDVLCRQLRIILAASGMSETDIHALYSGELAPVIKQLAEYEQVPMPRAAQAQEEMSLRARLLSTAAARFYEATKRKPAIIEAETSTIPEPAALTTAAEVVDQKGDNQEAPVEEPRTIAAEPMPHELPKAPAEAAATAPIEAVPVSPEAGEERSVASLMAQADRLIALTRNRRKGERELVDGTKVHAAEDATILSHKDAKVYSDDFAAARSEITKIKNRLRAILEDRQVAEKRAEIAELRSSLAGHLWALRKDFPITKAEEATQDEVVSDEVHDGGVEVDTQQPEMFSVAEIPRSDGTFTRATLTDVLPDGRLQYAWMESGEKKFKLLDSAEVRQITNAEIGLGDVVSIPRADGSRNIAKVTEQFKEQGTVKVIWEEGNVLKTKVILVGDAWPTEAPTVHDENIRTTEPGGAIEHVAADEEGTAEAAADVVEASIANLPRPDYELAAKEAGADVSLQQSVAAAVAAARKKLDAKIAETGSYRNSILAGTEGDRLMTLKQKLQTIEERLAAAEASPDVMRPEEVQALRSKLADVEYALNQMEAMAPKKLLGLPVPRANDGPFAVRAFRDALNLEWQPFKRASENSTDDGLKTKRQAFESIFKMLAYVPESGLTEAEATELRRLTESIGLPARISGEYVPLKEQVTPEADKGREVLTPLVLTGVIGAREEAAAVVLNEKLPAVINKEIDPKRESKARRWFERGGILTAGLLLGLLAGSGQDEKKDVTGGKSPTETSAPAASPEPLEPTITIKPEVKPIEGRWPTGDSVTVTPSDTLESGDSTAVEPTITDVTDRVIAEGERVPDYTVKASDNLWDFAEGDVESREPLPPLKGLSELQKSLVLNDMVTALKYSPDRMRSLGLRSGNPNLIFPGEVIKTQVLVDLLNEIKRDRGLA